MFTLCYLLIISRVSASVVIDELPQPGPFIHNCDEQQHSETVYFGWPHSLSCAGLKPHLQKPSNEYEDITGSNEYNGESTGDYNATCVVWDLDKQIVILNETASLQTEFSRLAFNISNFSHATSRNYSLFGWVVGYESDCVSIRSQLKVSNFSYVTCHESHNLSNAINRTGYIDDWLTFSCEVPKSVKPGLHKHIIPNYTANWYRNCGPLPDDYMITGSWNDKLHVSKLTYEHPGVYSCAVTHNGMMRFVNHYRFCVSPPSTKSELSLKCSKKKYHATIGKRIIIECTGTTQESTNPVHIDVLWSKISPGGNPLNCTNEIDAERRSENHGRATCWYTYFENTCFHHVPTAEERSLPSRVISMQLIIDDVEEEDLGIYNVEYKTILFGSTSVRETFYLVEDKIPFLLSNVAAAGACAVIFFIFIILIFFLWWRRVYLKVYYRRRFGSYSIDNKQYGAFLSYHFSYNLDQFAQKQIRGVNAAIRDELENQGYKIYDQAKESCTLEMRAEDSINRMKQSHRVVVILTLEYIKDQWSIFNLQTGFDEMLRSESKLIFILVPGIKEHIKQHAKTDETFMMVQRAMKLNCVIEWSEEKKFDKKYFSILLELAMPKLRSQKMTRNTSTSSTVNSDEDAFKNSFKRTLSNETGTTEISSPANTEERFAEFSIESETSEESVL